VSPLFTHVCAPFAHTCVHPPLFTHVCALLFKHVCAPFVQTCVWSLCSHSVWPFRSGPTNPTPFLSVLVYRAPSQYWSTGLQGAALDTLAYMGQTIDGPTFSYECLPACPSGKTRGQSVSPTCSACDTGKYGDGVSVCVACPAGSHHPDRGGTVHLNSVARESASNLVGGAQSVVQVMPAKVDLAATEHSLEGITEFDRSDGAGLTLQVSPVGGGILEIKFLHDRLEFASASITVTFFNMLYVHIGGPSAILFIILAAVLVQKMSQQDVNREKEKKLSVDERLVKECDSKIKAEYAWLLFELSDGGSDLANGVLVFVEGRLAMWIRIPFVIIAVCSVYAGFMAIVTRLKVAKQYKLIRDSDEETMKKYSKRHGKDGGATIAFDNPLLQLDFAVLHLEAVNLAIRNGWVEDLPSLILNLVSVVMKLEGKGGGGGGDSRRVRKSTCRSLLC